MFVAIKYFSVCSYSLLVYNRLFAESGSIGCFVFFNLGFVIVDKIEKHL